MKKSFKPGTLLGPVPAVMVSVGDEEKNNIITIAWTGIVNSEPPMTYISVRKSRYSHHIIEETGEFVINLTTKDLAYQTDWCGVKSGREYDKFREMKLTPVKAQIVKCPMIAESPLNLECRVVEKHEYGSHDMFVAEIVRIHVNDELLDENGRFELEKAGMIAYMHSQYYELAKRPMGRFGYSVMKPKTQKRKSKEEHIKRVQANRNRRKKADH